VTVIIGLEEWKKTEVLATKPEILKSHEWGKSSTLGKDAHNNTYVYIVKQR